MAPIIDVDARKALQVRWAYQARLLEQAILTGNELAQDRVLEVLKAIEEEAIKSGALEDLDTGDGDYATTRMSPITAKAAHGHRAEIRGGYDRLNALVCIPKQYQRGDGRELVAIKDEDGDIVRWVTDEQVAEAKVTKIGQVGKIQQPRKREKVKVDIMALGQRTSQAAGQAQESQFKTPISQVGKQAGQPLSQAPRIAVSKAEQLKALKKAKAGAAGQGTGQTGQDPTMPRATTATPKKPKVVTKCLDGCGADCGGRFAIGHDAKLKKVLMQIERGETDISQLPEIVRPFVQFSKPVVVATADGKGKVTTYQLLRAPVRMYGRDEVEYVQDLGEAFGHK